MCLTHTILDEPDISKPSSSGSSDTLMIVSLPRIKFQAIFTAKDTVRRAEFS